MLDFARLGDVITGLVGGSASEAAGSAGDLNALMQSAGLDPSALAGLGPDQVIEMLAAHGIDTQAIDPGQITALLQEFGLNESTFGSAASWLDIANDADGASN